MFWPEVFWCFQGVHKKTSGMKWVYRYFSQIMFSFSVGLSLVWVTLTMGATGFAMVYFEINDNCQGGIYSFWNPNQAAWESKSIDSVADPRRKKLQTQWCKYKNACQHLSKWFISRTYTGQNKDFGTNSKKLVLMSLLLTI